MTKKVKSSPKEKKGTYQDDINTKTLDLIDSVSENVRVMGQRLDVMSARVELISARVERIANRIGLV